MTLDADLVLEGGGVKGTALVGAISVLEERGFRFQRVAGTSAGAIVGALVAAGMPTAQMKDILFSLDYQRFRDGLLGRMGPIGHTASLLLYNGIHRGDYLRDWLGALLADRDVRTFGDLRRHDPGAGPGQRDAPRFIVTTSDISQGRLRYFPQDYSEYGLDGDDVAVVDAVRASMSIPYFYRPTKLRHTASGRSWLVDGGMLSNFPIGILDRTDRQRPRWPTIGIKLSARPDSMQGIKNPIRGVLSMTKAMVATMTSFYDQIHLDDPAVVARTIFVDTLKVRATDFDLDKRTRQQLYDNGRAAATKFLDGDDTHPAWDFDDYISRFREPLADGAGS